jgi:leishmanolysin-like peptidase
MILLHELTHILVFDKELLDASIYEEIEILGQNRTIITSPKVKEMAKRHFGCPNLKGIELENQDYDWKNTENEENEDGDGGSDADTNQVFLDKFSNHWDARTMLTDYMTSILYDEMVISDITLALFEDSGWYKVKYYTGGLFR